MALIILSLYLKNSNESACLFVFAVIQIIRVLNLLWFKYYICIIFGILQGSKPQLEEVWEEEDGLDKEQFNPKTFFKIHGK